MKALLLAAGEGTRLRPYTNDRPKPMVEVAGEPAIGYALRWLLSNGVTHVAINLHHHPDILRDFVGDGARFGVRVRYSLEPQILGTAGALRPLTSFFRGKDAFIVLYGDVLTNLSLRGVVEAHDASRADATVVLTQVEDPTRAGVVAFNRDGWITRLVEKPSPAEVFSEWANAGVYVCGQRVLDYVAADGPQDFARDLFPAMLRHGGRLRAHPTYATVIDYGAPERLEIAARAIADGALTPGAEGTSC